MDARAGAGSTWDPRASRIIGIGVGLGLTALAWSVGSGWLGHWAAVPAALLWWIAAQGARRIDPALLVAVSVLLHLGLALSGFQSNDLHRYLWEGTVQLEGVSPLATPPDHPSLSALRDARYERVLYPDLPSIYPPLAQASFAAAAALGIGELGYRNAMIAASLALTGLILLWLRATGRPLTRTIFYAWSPVAVLGAVGGHIDVLMCLALVGFVWAWEVGRLRLAGLLLGAAILAKTLAVLALPWALRRQPRAVLLTVLPVVLIGYAPYLMAGDAFGSLLTFAREFRFNGPAYAGLHELFGAGATVIAGLLLAVWVGFWSLREQRVADLVVRVLLGCLLLAPVVHYWYLTWALAVLPGVQSARLRTFVLTWCASIAVTVPLYSAIAAGRTVPSAGPLILVEMGLPVLAVLLLGSSSALGRRSAAGPDSPRSIGASHA